MNKYKIIFEDYLNSFSFPKENEQYIKFILSNPEAKRLRPSLVLAWCENYSGKLEEALPLALAIECLHSASLIQDDLPSMDDEKIRRGHPTLHTITNEATAILISDVLISLSYSIILESNLNDKQKVAATILLSTTFKELCLGQLREFNCVSNNILDLLNINTLKTGSLLSCSCIMGLIAAGLLEEEWEIAKDYGNLVGELFQIIDDWKDEDGTYFYINDPLFQDFLKQKKQALKENTATITNDFLLNLSNQLFEFLENL